MLQPVLKAIEGPEEANSTTAKPASLSERLDKEFPVGARLAAAKPEPTATSMAERFAPRTLRAMSASTLRATRDDTPVANDVGLNVPPPETKLFAPPTRGVVVVLTGVAIAPAAILAGLLWFGAIRGPDIGPQAATPPQRHEASIAATPGLRTTPRPPEIALTSPEELVAQGGDTIAFAIAVDAADALPARSAIAIRDLPEGATFSKGRPFGDREWSLSPNETADLRLLLPDGLSGASDLAVELVSADGTVLARTATRLDVAPSPTAGLVVRSGEEDRVGTLMEHGLKMIAVGYFAGARAYYQRAAEAGSGEAALAVGATYDPAFISALQAQGIKPDPELAETWYSRAAALGVADRAAQLATLQQTWLQAEAAEAANAAGSKPQAAQQPRQVARVEEEPGPFGRLVAAATELTSSDEWVEVSNPVNVRKGPSSSDETFRVAQKGTRLRVLGRDGNWVQIADPATNQEGWIYKRFLTASEAP